MNKAHTPPPAFNPVPAVVWLFALSIIGIEVLFSLGEMGIIGGVKAIGWRLNALSEYGFSGVLFDRMVQYSQMPLQDTLRFFTYPFVHGDFTATLFSAVLILAMGKLVCEAMGPLGFVIIFVFSGVFGALVFGFLTSQAWLVGAFPSAYGLIGAYTFLLWQRLASVGAQGMQQFAAFRLIGFLMGIQLVFGILFNTGMDWVAELAGFVCGFALCILVIPGGLARIRSLIQRD